MPHNKITSGLEGNTGGIVSPITDNSQNRINEGSPQSTLKKILCLWVVSVVYSAFLIHNQLDIEW